jgi:SpoVK/Ycf46/Vps4 family AAA+-type ATPase
MYDDPMDSFMFESKKKRSCGQNESSRHGKKRRVGIHSDHSEQSDYESYSHHMLKEYQPPQHNRATRYALRYKEVSSSINETQDDKNIEEASYVSENEHGESSGHDEDAEDHNIRRYSLRQRDRNNQSRQHDSQDEHLVRRGSNKMQERNVAERNARARARAARMEQNLEDSHIDGANEETSAFLNESDRRYSLRDRSKVQRSEATPALDGYNPYTGYNKRQSEKKRSHYFSSNSRSGRNRERVGRRRHRDGRRSHSSSSSSDDEFYRYNDSDEGGMARSGRSRRSVLPSNSSKSRADLSPVEIDPSFTWESVGGLEMHIEALKEMVMLPLLYPEFYEKYHVTPPSGVLFHGPPGTGKTLLARVLANSYSIPSNENNSATKGSQEMELGRRVTFYMRKGADCLSKWVGEAERQLRLLFEEAKRNQPSIIFFDEIDGLAPVRSAKQDQIHASIVSTLLALMDGLDSRGRVVVIGATNRLDAIDPALRRPGRFDRELGFKLPNVHERKHMLQIHSKNWKPNLTDAFIQELAERTVGYCGADIKALCAEAALCSLRRIYPQVYSSQQKLLIQLDRIVVSRGDFLKAMKKITPASHRSSSSFASPLPRNVKVLLQDPLQSILRNIALKFPLFPMDVKELVDVEPEVCEDEGDSDHDTDNIYNMLNHDDCDVCHGDAGELVLCDGCPAAYHITCLPATHDQPEEEGDWVCPDCLKANRGPKKHKVRARIPQQHVGFPRVLISGASGMGQQYIGSGILHILEGMSHFSLDYPSLVADVNTHHVEEALVRKLAEAQKCLPCVVYLPHADMWWDNTTESMHLTLKMMLLNMQVKANLPVIFLAWASSPIESLPGGLRELFEDQTNSSLIFTLSKPDHMTRKNHFAQVFQTFATAPSVSSFKSRRTAPKKLEVLPLAPLPPPKNQHVSMEELLKMREKDLHCLRELRIFLGQVLDYCSSQKQYGPFHYPVDPEAIPDYYLIVENPMDLSNMREKLNDGDYTSFDQFMDDIQLIVKNANIFNPKRSATRHIAHAAGTMKDNILSFAHRFRKQQGYDLFEKCREVTKRLHDNPQLYHQSSPSRKQLLASNKSVTPVVAPARSSARLKGEKAPEPAEICTPVRGNRKRNIEDGFDTPSKIEIKGQNDSNAANRQVLLSSSEPRGNNENKEEDVEQWFEEEELLESLKNEVISTANPNTEVCEIDLTENDEKENFAVETQQMPLFKKDDLVFVQARTFPGMNKLGGAGMIVQRNNDESYHVKYVLGGSEKNVEAKYISLLTEDSVKESIKNQRTKEDIENKKSAIDAKQKTPEQLKADFLFELIWPILQDERWQRQEKENGITHFFPPNARQLNLEPVVGTDNLLAHVKADANLAIKCFGKRYMEEMQTEVVFGAKNEGTNVSAEPAASNANASEHNEEDKEQVIEEHEQEYEAKEQIIVPDFIYDQVTCNFLVRKLYL